MIGLLDIGGTKLLASVADAQGRLGRVVRMATPSERPGETLAAMLDEVRDGRPLQAIGCAVPGPFDRERAAFTNPPNLTGPWQQFSLRDELGGRFGCPVLAENDANVAGLAEARFGVAAGMRTVVYYTVSTGIGTGTVQDGHVLINRHDTEGGHQVLWPDWLGGVRCPCGGTGCLEALASGSALERRFGRRPELIEDQEVWDEVGRWLGMAVANTTALIDPDAIVFGGGVCNSWDRFWPSLEATARRLVHLQPLPLLLHGTLGDNRNLLGALALVQAAA